MNPSLPELEPLPPLLETQPSQAEAEAAPDDPPFRLVVRVADGEVVVEMSRPVARIAIDPKSARHLAELLRKASYVAGGGAQRTPKEKAKARRRR